MAKTSADPRTYLREAVVLADLVSVQPQDKNLAIKLALKVQALDEALRHGSYKLVRK